MLNVKKKGGAEPSQSTLRALENILVIVSLFHFHFLVDLWSTRSEMSVFRRVATQLCSKEFDQGQLETCPISVCFHAWFSLKEEADEDCAAVSFMVQLAQSSCKEREENIKRLQVTLCGFRGSRKTYDRLYASTNCSIITEKLLVL